MGIDRKWWKEAVVYQIYPRSFSDSNGDGVGDLRGILSKLDYLQDLGVNVLWLCPVYESPNDDNGYDISDYYKIMPDFGTMEDFEELLREAHRRGLKIIMDLVVNHTSDEHAWFRESRSSKQSEKRDFYIWRPGKNGREPNNWASFFTPSAWEYENGSGEYYLHLFSKKQPDLNWENKKVRETVYDMMDWWLKKGIDGFRMDVINCISKTQGLPDVPLPDTGYQWAGQYFMNGPEVHNYLREMNERVLSKYDIMTVGETPGVAPEDALRYAGNDGRELNMVFQSELMDVDAGPSGKWESKPWGLPEFKSIVFKWQNALDGKAWNSIFLGNHDQPRCLSRFGNDDKYQKESAKMLATLLLTLQGTPYIFQGDELGMTNMCFKSIEDCRDIEAINYYKSSLQNGLKPDEIITRIREKSRDNARTPMQWTARKNAGFSQGKPWIEVNKNHTRINAENEENGLDSILNYYRRLIRIRHEFPALVYGHYTPLYENDEHTMSYIRTQNDTRLLVILNFTTHEQIFRFPEGCLSEHSYVLMDNIRNGAFCLEKEIQLQPYEACIIAV